MTPLRYTLRKREILRGYRSFADVLAKGQSVQSGAVRCFFLQDPNHGKRGVRVGFSVARGVRKAVTRNLIKRRLREAYRRNKQLLLETPSSHTAALQIVFLYVGPRDPKTTRTNYAEIERSMTALLTQVSRRI